MLTPNLKHSKWDQEWQSHLQLLSSDLDRAKQAQTKTLLSEREKLATEKVNLTTEIRKLKQEQASLANVFAYHQQAQKELKRLNAHQATQEPRQKNFLGTGSGTKWNGTGWLNSAQTHFTPSSGKLDNLYSVKFGSQTAETTEEQVLQLIARTVKALQKIESSDFEAKFNAKETDSTKQAQVSTSLAEIKAQEIIVGSDKDSEGNPKQPTYDFAYSYQKYTKSTNTWTAYTSPAFNLGNFFEFINLTHGQAFLSDLDADKQKQVDKNQPWTIFLKGETYETDKLKDYGINIDSSKTTLYKTSETEKKVLSTSGGISGWLDLAHSITQNSNNLTKLQGAFTNSPTQTLLQDLKSWTPENGFVTNRTSTLPESIDSLGVVISELETKKLNNVAEQALLARTISEKNKELKTKIGELKGKETSLNTLIQEIITKQRDQLKSYSITNGFTDANKRTERDLWQIRQFLLTLRYLENDGDTTALSSVPAENTASDQLETLLEKLSYGNSFGGNKVYLVRFFQELAFKKVGDKVEQDIQQALSRIKAGKYTTGDGKEHKIYSTLDQFKQHFEEKDKLVKLTDWEKQAREALKGTDEPAETLTDWQTKLKTLDPLLTETVITQEKMQDFQKHQNFKKISGVEGLIKKVMDQENKVKADFISRLEKEDNEVKDLAKMITKFEAEKVIKLISLFDYEKNLTAEKQKEFRRKFSWDRQKKVGSKYVGESEDYPVSDEDKKLEGDFTKFLFELATGTKSLSLIERPSEQNGTPTKGHFEKYWGWYAGAGGVLGIGGVLAVVFWEKIKNWWEPKEEVEQTDNEQV
ncbi:MAG: hypothetical protein I3274_02610 [Candidatus Moeniiplasma glomeromycotorum]|nr:hypothetical protein [Candidatus Moeniiplasma glomeromycotorum]MCE8167496.1 hypothetical protein [Candidatus Moeniiplasma glomeromycotorum]